MNAAQRLAPFAAALVAASMGCSTTDTTPTGAALGAPSLTIASPAAGATVPMDCESASLGVDAGATSGAVAVRVNATNWSVREPGACLGQAQCGPIGLWVDASPQGDGGNYAKLSAAPLVEVPVTVGTHTITVGLIADGDVVPALGADGKPLAQSISVTVTAPTGCDGGADAGTDADDGGASDAAVDAGDAADEADASLEAGDAADEADASLEAGDAADEADASAEAGDAADEADASLEAGDAADEADAGLDAGDDADAAAD